ncbi:chromate efflux transporter [Brevibacillus sp. WF146]|uniref:chromate efflux transporter n=1 Tax=Brevibacillus sp. WF146 TaxID=319501 RepID=UPI0007EDFDB8|nr:chromate efflux transporter [Brevibacillus sp. WF146]UYZ13297.1 chromate efflux transporter [Brevibacillus sp. WF146]
MNRHLPEVAQVFLKLGSIAFGGPAAHIAMMNEEIVQKRKWVDQETFLDLLGASNLIPGPNSTELAIHLGYRRAGWPGLIVAGVCFIAPAMLIVLAFAMLYVRFGSLPQLAWVLYGIKPVILAIVLQALWGLARTAVKDRATGMVGAAALAAAALGMHEIPVLALAGLAVLLIRQGGRLQGRMHALSPVLPMWGLWAAAKTPAADAASLGKLFVLFLKIGSVLYGSGYVLLAFLQSEFVRRWPVLTPEQLLDAVAVGQFTPGPVFTTATFVGYLVGGTPGAVLATIGIFLPAFVFVAVVNPWVDRLRRSPVAGSLLDGVNVASLALMALVSAQLGTSAVTDWLGALLLTVSLFLVIRFRINSAWLVLGGGLVGLAAAYM